MRWKVLFYFWFVFLFLISISGVCASFNDTDFEGDCVELDLDDSIDEIDGANYYLVELPADEINDVNDSFIDDSDDVEEDLNNSSLRGNIKTSITASNFVKYYRDSSVLYAYLKDGSGNPLSGKTVVFKYCGNTYQRTTNSNGRAGMGIYATPGTYSMEISFSASGYVSSKKTISVTVLTMPTSITTTNYNCNWGSTTTTRACLKDRNGDPLANKTVIFTHRGNNFTRVTNSNGYAYFGVNSPPGEYNVLVTFSANGYQTSTKTFRVVVNPLSASLTVNNLTFYYGEEGILKAYVKDNNGNALANANVLFNVSGSIYTNTTDSNGIASLVIYKPSGTYNVSVCLNQVGYVSVNKTVNVVVNSRPVVWSNHVSDLYTGSISVNLFAWSSVDDNPVIYYTLDGSDPLVNGILYGGVFNVSSTTCLKFYARDNESHCSNVVLCNYIFGNVGNINSGKGFSSIQSAIDDDGTVDGDTIKVNSGFYHESITLNKQLNLIANSGCFLQGVSSYSPVIGVNSTGSNSLIYGFNIVNSEYGIVVLGAGNVTILSNNFTNVVSAIETDQDNGTVICGNIIQSGNVLSIMQGITVYKSNNLIICDNLIELNSYQDSYGIFLINETSRDIMILNNNISNKLGNGFGLYIFI